MEHDHYFYEGLQDHNRKSEMMIHEKNSSQLPASHYVEDETGGFNSGVTSIAYTDIVVSRSSSILSNSPVVRTISFGLNGLLLSSYMISSAKLLAMLGDSEVGGAHALIFPFQGAMLAIAVGPILAMGLDMARATGGNEYKKAGDIVRTGWILTTGLGGVGSIIMLSTRAVFPHMLAPSTADAAVAFFSGCSIGNIPLLILISDALVAFETGDWYIPAAIGASIFSFSLGSSYLLAFNLNLGVLGVGLGSSVGPLITFGLMRAWFTREAYQKYEFYKLLPIQDFKQIIKSILRSGWQLSLQRLTEWTDLFLLTMVIGIENDDALKATGPSVQYVGLIASALQGIAAISGMSIARNNGAKQAAIIHNECAAAHDSEAAVSVSHTQGSHAYEIAIACNKKNIRVIMQYGAVALGITITVALPIYFARQPLTKFFLADVALVNSTTTNTSLVYTATPRETPNTNIASFAETLLWINLIGLLPDTARIVLMGSLRGWKDILFPTMVSLISMVVIGIPIGWVIGDKFEGNNEVDSKPAWMLYTRNLAIFISVIVIGLRCVMQLFKDQRAYEQHMVSRNEHAFFRQSSVIGIERRRLFEDTTVAYELPTIASRAVSAS